MGNQGQTPETNCLVWAIAIAHEKTEVESIMPATTYVNVYATDDCYDEFVLSLICGH